MILSEEKTRYLDGLENRVSEIEQLLSFEEVLVDPKLVSSLKKELSEISPIVKSYKLLKEKNLNQPECENLVLSILDKISKKRETNETIIVFLQPPNQLAFDLKSAYKIVCETENLMFTENSNYIKISGQNALSLFENENGLHRSENEDVTVIVISEPENGELFNIQDVRFDIFHSSGAGGQNINKVATAVRATHIKSNISVVCQDERTQSQNKQKAIENLKSKYEKSMQKKYEAEISRLKKHTKSDRVVRTYNYKQNLVRDTKSNLQMSKNAFFTNDIINVLKTNITRS